MTHHFASFARSGLAAQVATPDTFDASLPARVTLAVPLRVNDITGRDVSKTLTLAGPGDIIGLDPGEIIRTEPRHLTTGFPSNLFAMAEFDRPDLPWLFTPAAPQGERLRPWVVLAVVRKSTATIRMVPGRPLPTLTCPASELPDLAESWLWAHAVYVGDAGASRVADLLQSRPNQSVSRLLCPRRLEPSAGGPTSGYYACVLPAFDVGRRAGLGEELSDADLATLAPAWSSSGIVEVPVYYQFEFDTASEGDFEEAVDTLTLRRAVADTPAEMDASQPDPRIPQLGPLTLPVGSALRVIDAPDPPVPAALTTLQTHLRTVLETPIDGGERVNAPIYGRWHSSDPGAHGPAPLATRSWLADLNLDPRFRVAAALGARVVQQQQEQLVASAWQQAGEAEAVNAFLRHKQLGREVSQAIYDKRIAPLSDATLAQITSAGIAPTAPGSSKPTAPEDLAATAVRRAMVSPAFRRLARPLGPRIAAPPLPPANLRILPDMPPTPAGPPPAKAVGTLLAKVIQGATVLHAAPSGAAKPTQPGQSGKLMSIVAKPAQPAPPRPSPAAAMKPSDTFKVDVQQRVVIPPEAAAGRHDPLAPVLFTPTFDHPMYEPLAELSADALLPGFDRIPDNSVTLLKVVPAFIEAYMAGANDEMSRELLWREFPAPLGGTYFRQFWDVRSQLPPGASPELRDVLRDIRPLAEWTKPLGDNLPASRGRGLFLMLFKGDLLRRFPTALIYAARATWPDRAPTPDLPVVDPDVPFVLPSLRLTPAPGITMLGFNLVGPGNQPVTDRTIAGAPTRDGDPGWFFVIEEHPTEPRFGLDLSRGDLTSWRELSWNDVATRPDGYLQASRLTPALAAPPATAPQSDRDRHDRDRNVFWNRSSADMAYITMQTPFRLELHSSYWFRPEAPK